jgi:pyruvate,water dikinase
MAKMLQLQSAPRHSRGPSRSLICRQQETFLNVQGVENVLNAVKLVFASLFNDRAISYRVHHGFDHAEVSLSAGIQRMVRSDIGSQWSHVHHGHGIGLSWSCLYHLCWGLESVFVQGSALNPDEFYVYKRGLAENRPAILRRNLGSKAIKMVYSDDSADDPSPLLRTDAGDRNCFSLMTVM